MPASPPAMTPRRCSQRGVLNMRIMVKFAVPLDAGNDLIRTGKIGTIIHQIVEDLKPEAAYFYPTAGERSGFFIVNMENSSQVAEVAERFFFGLNARLDMVPVMTPDDLGKAMSGMKGIVARYG
jgi:Domain of unknown function (DUF3303)